MGLWPSAILQMPTGNDKFQAAADAASCAFLLAAGGTATQVAAYNLLTGNLVVGGVAAAAAGIAVYAYGKGCQWDSTPPTPGDDVTLPCCPQSIQYTDEAQCWGWGAYRVSDGYYNIVRIGRSFGYTGSWRRGYVEPPSAQGASGKWVLKECNLIDGDQGSIPSVYFDPAVWRDVHIVPPQGIDCSPEPTPLPQPYTYTDPDDGCQISVQMEGWAVTGDGNYTPVWRMDPILPPAVKAGGGAIIGACNFAPTYYFDGGGGGPRGPFPVPPVPGPGNEPGWLDPLLDFLSDLGSNIITDKLKELFEAPLPAYQYTMRAACNYKQDGTFETYTINLPAEIYSERMLSLQEMQMDFLQQHLLWKTPTCSGGGQSVSGDAVSINWVSDEYSAAGGNKLRKLFTYFDQNNTTLEATVDHWKDFSFEAGAVIVSINGTDLGKPQVWASSVDEGKRVIEHAAAIAGVDLKDAEWIVTAPRSARYGQPGTMRVQRGLEGSYFITKRDGPSGLPEVLTPSSTHGSS